MDEVCLLSGESVVGEVRCFVDSTSVALGGVSVGDNQSQRIALLKQFD